MAAPAAGTVEVRYCLTDGTPPAWLAQLTQLVSLDERDRAARFLFDCDRRDFVLAHVLLRTTLSEFASTGVADWLFTAGADGKPVVDLSIGTPLDFNLSHTRGLVACAVARDADLGIDVERVDCTVTPTDLASVCLSSEESACLFGLPKQAQSASFVALWTLKEAYMKALGCGLAIPPNALSFRTDPGGRVSCVSQKYPVAPNWHFEATAVSEGYRLAIAVHPRTNTPGGVRVNVRSVRYDGLWPARQPEWQRTDRMEELTDRTTPRSAR
jgi:4'-phosphopantetheinyl transferase